MAPTDLSLRLGVLRSKNLFPTSALDDFEAFLQSAPDEALFRMSPLRYATAWGLSEHDGIELFLQATHVGILDFAWGLLCHGCMAFLTTAAGLRSLESKHCNFCDFDIEGSIDDRIEVAFTVAPSVRRIRFHSPETVDLRRDALRVYFSTSLSPESNPHRLMSDDLSDVGRTEVGGIATLRLDLEEGMYALLIPSSHVAVFFSVRADGATEGSVDVLDGQAIPKRVRLRPGQREVRIQNRSSRSIEYFVTKVKNVWPEPAERGSPLNHLFLPYLTGSRLITSQSFRDLFRAESIPSAGGLELKNLTVLFTDLKGSTALYERVGDLRAYELVRKHFDVLRAIVAAEGGAVVKTIGDAVMASFAEPVHAVSAAIRMNDEIHALGEEDLSLKVGLHSGPCIAVELNERLDYFGRTVNIAARVQGLSEPGEIVCTEAVFDAPKVRERVAAGELVVTRTMAQLKGITDEVPVVRLSRAG